MPKPRDLATLRDAVRSAAFTPPRRDLDGLVELLGDEDEAVVHGAELAIVRAAADAAPLVPRLLALLERASPAARARGLRVVGRLAPTDAESAKAVLAALRDADPRVRRGAANALGRMQGSEAASEIAAALVVAWDEAPELPLARALAEAMGKLGVVEALDRLDSLEDGDVELARIARKASAMLRRDGSRGESSEIDGARAGEMDVEIVLLCRAGLETLVIDELRERCPRARAVRAGVGDGSLGSGHVLGTWRGALDELMTVRTALGVAFALPAERVRGDDPDDDAEIEAACVRAITSEKGSHVLETWTRGAVRYRLAWEGKGHRRGTTWRVIHALSERRPGWINNPTASTWEVRVSASHGEVRILLLPRKLSDPRFVYRVRDVPAASHPTIAAALVRASRPRADDVVWDPFVGSASELVERAKAGPYRRLIGSDTDPEALVAARANLEAAGLAEGRQVTLELGDATEHAPPRVTSIITNPPMGRRVARDGSLANLLDRFCDHAAGVLAPGGRLTWLSPLGARTAARAEANRLRVALRQPVDMGGFHAELQVWEKPVA